ncbi:hypothetical protein FRX31_009696 [Thalictrum thalictroides]|uniref:Uncharacterized protein n=1 Tax=Thalictrum thalictroides TaxID=46969 RepID=A0A7J6WUY1_THATH|nr:hypothetical protein FRX31_009696 [Thalictrum thalictroides]
MRRKGTAVSSRRGSRIMQRGRMRLGSRVGMILANDKGKACRQKQGNKLCKKTVVGSRKREAAGKRFLPAGKVWRRVGYCVGS